LDWKSFRAFAGAHYQLLGVLLGAFLIAASTSTYTNWDAQLEFEAASNVVTRGFPFVTTGLMINQPPMGFYMDAPIFHTFGLTYLNGIGIATAFGLGSVALTYALGSMLYGKRTGLVAAALFSIIPWHIYISRIFLIDNQNLFFSLLFLVAGILAIRKNSQKLLAIAGTFFAIALMTKLFAIFMIAPLLLMIYFEKKETLLKPKLRDLLIFIAPTLILQTIWFGGFANQNFLGVYFSSDFTHPVLVANPLPLFWPTVLVKSAGWFLFLAAIFSLTLSLAYRKLLTKTLRWDALCLVTIAIVAGLNSLLVLGFHLIVPYVSVIKYSYVSLPFFCLLAASVADKGSLLIASIHQKKKKGIVKPVLVGLGAVLLFASLLESTLFLIKWLKFVSFGVDSITYYPFNVFSGPIEGGFQAMHYAALGLVVLSIGFPFIVRGLKKSIGWT
jgi:4-amino-4-deoxy-L-arabinose transferase-like glycosyltransferase